MKLMELCDRIRHGVVNVSKMMNASHDEEMMKEEEKRRKVAR